MKQSNKKCELRVRARDYALTLHTFVRSSRGGTKIGISKMDKVITSNRLKMSMMSRRTKARDEWRKKGERERVKSDTHKMSELIPTYIFPKQFNYRWKIFAIKMHCELRHATTAAVCVWIRFRSKRKRAHTLGRARQGKSTLGVRDKWTSNKMFGRRFDLSALGMHLALFVGCAMHCTAHSFMSIEETTVGRFGLLSFAWISSKSSSCSCECVYSLHVVRFVVSNALNKLLFRPPMHNEFMSIKSSPWCSNRNKNTEGWIFHQTSEAIDRSISAEASKSAVMTLIIHCSHTRTNADQTVVLSSSKICRPFNRNIRRRRHFVII